MIFQFFKNHIFTNLGEDDWNGRHFRRLSSKQLSKKMVASGSFLTVSGDVVVLVRDKTLFVLAAGAASSSSSAEKTVEFELLQEQEVKDAVLKAEEVDEENPNNQQHAVTVNCITGVEFFQPEASKHALLVLVDERKLVHYEVDFAAGKVVFQSLRYVPYDHCQCMFVSRAFVIMHCAV